MKARMDRITFRIPPELFAEADRQAKAAGISVGLWARKLIEKETGIHVEVKMGLAGTDKKTLRRVQSAGVKAIKKKLKEHSHAK